MAGEPRNCFRHLQSMKLLQASCSAVLNRRLPPFNDLWIAVVDNRIVAEGNSAKEVFDRAKKVSPHC